MRLAIFPHAIIASLLLAACGDNTKEVPTSECSSGTKWIGGDEESDQMHPGMDCIGCHTSRGEGPRFTVAGTVYEGPNAANDCFGVGGATIRITGADGRVQELTTNGAGNFATRASFVAPYKAEIVRGGAVVAAMKTPQTTGACNLCHQETGTPGRIRLR
jgi:hypothetical protein